MNFEIKGMTFNESDLDSINLDELKVGDISLSHMFFIPPFKHRALLVLRAGDYIDDQFIEKFKSKEISSLYALPIALKVETELYRELFDRFKSVQNEKQRLIVSQAIIQRFAHDFWCLGESSYLSFTQSCFEIFCRLPEEVVRKYQTTSLTMYSRSMISASVAVMNCLIHQIVDFDFISDMYSLVFALDYGLVAHGNLSYSLVQACERERNNPGEGIRYLEKENRSLMEIEAFRNHPQESAHCLYKYKTIFNNPEIIESIRYHHEKSDGSGFPGGYSYSGLSDFETFLIFCDVLIPFQEHLFCKGDGYQLIKGQFEKLKENKEKYNLPINKILKKWDAIMRWAIDKKINHEEISKCEVA